MSELYKILPKNIFTILGGCSLPPSPTPMAKALGAAAKAKNDGLKVKAEA